MGNEILKKYLERKSWKSTNIKQIQRLNKYNEIKRTAKDKQRKIKKQENQRKNGTIKRENDSKEETEEKNKCK